MINKKEIDNHLKDFINDNINFKKEQNENSNDINLEKEDEPITEIYNNVNNIYLRNNDNENNLEKEQIKNIEDKNDIDDKKRKNTMTKDNSEANDKIFNNSKNANKIIVNKQKNEVINKENNDINNINFTQKNIKINNFLPASNPQIFNFFNILSKPVPIIPPQNVIKNRNNTIKDKSKDKNIFQRLFKEAQYQRIFPKKPCHFRYKKSSHNKELLTLIESDINKKKKKLNLKIGNKTSNNYGEYLYERDKKYQEEKEKKIVLMKQKKYQEEKKFYTFKPIVDFDKKDKSNFIKKDMSFEEKRVNDNYNENNDIKNYLYVNNNYKSANFKYKENLIKNSIDKNNNKMNNNKYQDNKSNVNTNNNKLFYNSNNIKKTKNKIKIPYDKNRKNNTNQQILDSRVKTKLEKNNLISSKSFSNKSLTNTNTIQFSEEENKKIFLNLFNAINKGESDYISGNSLNLSKVPKNILIIINPIIKELLNNKYIRMNKEEFITCMNELFNNISSVDKRLIIYTYNNRHKKNKSLVLTNNKNNFNQIKIRSETPDYSLKSKFSYYYNNNIPKKQMNNLKNNFGFQSSKAQKKIEEFLYGNDSNFYYGF